MPATSTRPGFRPVPHFLLRATENIHLFSGSYCHGLLAGVGVLRQVVAFSTAPNCAVFCSVRYNGLVPRSIAGPGKVVAA